MWTSCFAKLSIHSDTMSQTESFVKLYPQHNTVGEEEISFHIFLESRVVILQAEYNIFWTTIIQLVLQKEHVEQSQKPTGQRLNNIYKLLRQISKL